MSNHWPLVTIFWPWFVASDVVSYWCSIHFTCLSCSKKVNCNGYKCWWIIHQKMFKLLLACIFIDQFRIKPKKLVLSFFYKYIPFEQNCLTSAVSFSLFVSISVIPMFWTQMMRFSKHEEHQHKEHKSLIVKIGDWFTKTFMMFVQSAVVTLREY